MDTRRFAQGDILFREGDAADRVFRLRSGAVEIVRKVGGQAVIMGTVGPGQFVGEMAALERRPHHSATARAATNSEADVLRRDEFLDQIERSSGVARNLIERLSQRLHAANERIVHDEAHGEVRGTPAEPQAHGVRIGARSDWLRHQMAEPVLINHLPFIVGRRPVHGERAARQRQDLLLDDQEPFRLSRDHFAIVGDNGRYFIRDMRSTLGTVVNDQAIGEHFRTDEARLREGENTVIAGGSGSRFVFSVNVG